MKQEIDCFMSQGLRTFKVVGWCAYFGELRMTPMELYNLITEHGFLSSIVVFGCSILIEKSKTIKLNPFSFIGNLLTSQIMDKVFAWQDITEEKIDGLKKDYEKLSDDLADAKQSSIDRYQVVSQKCDELKLELRYDMAASSMKQYRVDFFRFEEGILRGVKYTKEHWHNMRNKVLEYQTFCNDNKHFINSECEEAMNTILEKWKEHPWEENENG